MTFLVLCVSNCQTVSRSKPVFALLRVDSPEIVLGPGADNRGPWVGFTFVNTTTEPISSGMCSPNLEAKVADKWVVAFYGAVLGCERVTFERGESYRERVPIFGSGLANQIDIRRRSESGDNLYRLNWKFVEGKDWASKSARSVQAFSNAFRITVQRPPQ